MSGLHSINHEQRLFVLKCGSGFSCLGFDVAAKRHAAYLEWLGMKQTAPIEWNTEAGYNAYGAALALVLEKCAKEKTRCPAELTPELIGLEGKRVEVTTPSGEKSRFYVSRSTGPIPIHIEIKRRDSMGGCGAYVPSGSIVRVVGER